MSSVRLPYPDGGQLGFAEELQAVPLCLLDELVEVHRIVDLGEIVVKEVRWVALQDVLELDLELGTGSVVHRPPRGDQPRQRLRLGDPRRRVGEVIGVEPQHLPRDPAHVAPRIGVVAHVGDAVRGQVAGHQLEAGDRAPRPGSRSTARGR